MNYIELGHYQMGIYHVRKAAGHGWTITVEDGRGFPFDPVHVATLRAARLWLGA